MLCIVFTKEFILKLASFLWILENFLNVFSLLIFNLNLFGDNKLTFLNDEYSISWHTLFEDVLILYSFKGLYMIRKPC